MLEGKEILQSYEVSILFLKAMDVLVDTLKQGLEGIVAELKVIRNKAETKETPDYGKP